MCTGFVNPKYYVAPFDRSIYSKILNTFCKHLSTDVLCVHYRGGFREGRQGCAPPFLAITCFFCDHLQELQTVFIEVKLIINNAALTYLYPNTIKTYLTPNHLIFSRQLLCYSDSYDVQL